MFAMNTSYFYVQHTLYGQKIVDVSLTQTVATNLVAYNCIDCLCML